MDLNTGNPVRKKIVTEKVASESRAAMFYLQKCYIYVCISAMRTEVPSRSETSNRNLWASILDKK